MKNGVDFFITSDENMVTMTSNMEPNYNEVKR